MSLAQSSQNRLKQKAKSFIKRGIGMQQIKQAENHLQYIYRKYCESSSLVKQMRAMWQIIEICYKNSQMQKQLCLILRVPFSQGPISLNPIPSFLLQNDTKLSQTQEDIKTSNSQLSVLFSNLQKNYQEYFCWIIYFNQQFRLLDLKLLKRQQIVKNQSLFNPNINLIGIFINKTQEKKQQLNKYKKQQDSNCKISKTHSSLTITANKRISESLQKRLSVKMKNLKYNKDHQYRSKSTTTKIKTKSASSKSILTHKNQQKSYLLFQKDCNNQSSSFNKNHKHLLTRQSKSFSDVKILQKRRKGFSSFKQNGYIQPLKNKNNFKHQSSKQFKKQSKLTKNHRINRPLFKDILNKTNPQLTLQK